MRPPCHSPVALQQWPSVDTRGRSWLIQELSFKLPPFPQKGGGRGATFSKPPHHGARQRPERTLPLLGRWPMSPTNAPFPSARLRVPQGEGVKARPPGLTLTFHLRGTGWEGSRAQAWPTRSSPA